jgi:GNAT superfamily N-acetyltransferase
MESRPFAGPDDLKAIRQLVAAGRASSPLSGYWHPGEVEWVYCYGPDRRPGTTVWTDAAGPAGWLLIDEDARSSDGAIRPDLRGGPAEEALVRHVEAVLGPGPVTTNTWADDEARISLLSRLGYQPAGPAYLTFVVDLDEEVEVPPSPDGFRLLDSLTDEWVSERGECHHRAFDPSRMTPEAYQLFRSCAPGYDPELDVGVVSDDGRVVSYAMAWADAVSRTGQLEPVGTRPHFWRRGLGQVAVREAMRRLRSRGMTLCSVNTWAGHAGNTAFYESCGFRRAATIDRWTRPA